jgi:hypothetical protein
VASGGGSSIWVASPTDQTLTKLQASTGTILGVFPIANGILIGWALAFDGTNIWVGNKVGTVTKVRASDGSTMGTFPVAPLSLSAIAFDGSNLWITTANGNPSQIVKMQASTGSVLGSYP